MEIKELAEYVKKNLSLILVLLVIMTPSVWTISSLYYSGKIDTLEAKNDFLSSLNQELENRKTEFKELLTEENVIDFSNIRSNIE